MSYSFNAVGKDKGKLKDAVRAAQVKDEAASPHSGIPKWVADHLCEEIDRVRILDFNNRQYALSIEANGSFHEQGNNHSMKITNVLLVE